MTACFDLKNSRCRYCRIECEDKREKRDQTIRQREASRIIFPCHEIQQAD